MKLAVIGTGYVGLVSGTCFAETGNDVICVDIDAQKVENLRSGIIPIYEPGLELLVKRNTENGRLKFTVDLIAAVAFADIIMLALPTPPGEGGNADLSYVLNMADTLSELIEKYTVVVNKSTVPIGTAEKVAARLSKNLDDEMFDVVSNPEFLREGCAVQDFLKPERVIIGGHNEKSFDIMDKLYRPFVRQGNPIHRMTVRSAEMTKYASNSYLATRISYMNEIANLSELLGANVDDVRRGMGADSRIGKRFLFPGIGYGGSCFPKDVLALSSAARGTDYDFKILKAVMNVNDAQKQILFKRIYDYFEGRLSDKRIGIWGLSFKPETDDIREAPALVLIEQLVNAGANVVVFDPEAMANVKAIYGDRIEYTKNPESVLDGCDALAICTEWNAFRSIDFQEFSKRMSQSVIFDGRNLFGLDEIEKYNDIKYYSSIGRPVMEALVEAK